jgi:hypothetical protein
MEVRIFTSGITHIRSATLTRATAVDRGGEIEKLLRLEMKPTRSEWKSVPVELAARVQTILDNFSK